MSESPNYKYKAFISYRHLDTKEACKLENFLEDFRLPKDLRKENPELPERLGKIFRDVFFLCPGKKLVSQIESALDKSENIIVLCSEHTGSSQEKEEGKRWVDEEVNYFWEKRKDDIVNDKSKVIPLILPLSQEFKDAIPKEEGDATPTKKDDFSLIEKLVLPRPLQNILEQLKKGQDQAWLIEDLNSIKENIECKKAEDGETAKIVFGNTAYATRKECYYGVVATLLGVDKDKLWYYVEEAERLRKRAKLIRNIIKCSILLAICAFLWDFCVPKVSYFRDYVECYNVPHGIHELTEKEISGLTIHYRFTEQFYKVQMVERCNSVGYRTDSNYPWALERPVAMKYAYDYLRNRVTGCDYLSKSGKVVTSLSYPENDPRMEKVNFIKKSDDGVELGTGLASIYANKDMGINFADFTDNVKKSEIAQMKLVRDSAGRVVGEKFLNHAGYPRKNEKGVWGYRYERDELGRVVKLRYLDSNGDAMSAKGGVAGHDITYHKNNGLAESFAYVDWKGHWILSELGWAVEKYFYDEVGNVTREMFLGLDGKPCFLKNGCAGAEWEYDERGNKKKQMYLGVDGKPCLHKDGNAGLEWEYDERGNEKKQMYLGLDGKPCLLKNGYAGAEREYDERGKVKKTIYLGVDGKPMIHQKFGFAGLEWEYDAKGNKIKEMYLGVDGKPCLHKDGFARVKFEYDERGNKKKQMCIGVDGKPCLHKDGFARVEFEYDERGNRTKQMFLGVDGKPCLIIDGYAGLEWVYDERGNMVKLKAIGVDGKPCRITNGHAEIRYEYNTQGQKTKETYYDEKGNCIKTIDYTK